MNKTIKLGAIADWLRHDKETHLAFPGGKSRKVRLDVATFIQTTFMLVGEGHEMFPLGTVNGHGTIEFIALGDVEINADANFYYRTAEGQENHSVIPDRKVFTKIAERRARNVEQEYMLYMANLNIEKRLAAAERELDRKFAAMNVDRKTGEVLGENGSGTNTGTAEKAPAKKPDGSLKDESESGGESTQGSGAGSNQQSGEGASSDGGQAISAKK